MSSVLSSVLPDRQWLSKPLTSSDAMIVDGNWVDITSLILAALTGLARPVRARISSGKWLTSAREVINDVLSGASVMPFVLMTISVVSSDALKAALETNKFYMAIGGLIGLVVIASEILKPSAACASADPVRTLAAKLPPLSDIQHLPKPQTQMAQPEQADVQ